jgi:hypothetical protein
LGNRSSLIYNSAGRVVASVNAVGLATATVFDLVPQHGMKVS